MASVMRRLLLRHACGAEPAKRTLQTKATSTFHSAASRPCSRTPLSQAVQQPNSITRNLPSTVRVAAFHTSSSKAILPPLPQKINGTANEAAPVPTPSPSHGAYHWTAERAVSVALIPLTIAPFAGGSAHPVVDAFLCGLLVVHSHIGFQSIITDYIPSGRLRKTRITFDYGLYAASAVVLAGLYEFETNDVGLTEGIKKIWHA